ncbi:hypothetical protein [uncultured Jannaschia sp.]|uniref:hypothetical protein n=1 Tax=uncultured Jannaschia sp. TaxID=293347 RepID=UPI0026171F47|nr:hypothetical protein [uncultured Jannaschia sp.]
MSPKEERWDAIEREILDGDTIQERIARSGGHFWVQLTEEQVVALRAYLERCVVEMEAEREAKRDAED